MPWNGSGEFTRDNGVFSGTLVWQDSRDADYDILASQHDTHDQDIATGLGIAVTKDGQSKMAANFVPGTSATYSVGTNSAAWTSFYASVSYIFKGTNFNTTLAYTQATAPRTITYPDASGDIQLQTLNSTKSANFAAEKNNRYFIDTDAITATLPAAPAVGDRIQFLDAVGTLTTFTIARNGKPIMSLAEDMTVDVTYFAFALVFDGDTSGWRIE